MNMSNTAPAGTAFEVQHQLVPTVAADTGEAADADEPIDLLGEIKFPRGFLVSNGSLTPLARLERKLGVLAARVLFGTVQESLCRYAARHGVLKQSLAKRVHAMATRLGIELYQKSDRHRVALALASKRAWDKRHAAKQREVRP